MHRSGTSCLAGSLQAAGASGGAIVEYANDNLLGNRENTSIMNLNKKILAHNTHDFLSVQPHFARYFSYFHLSELQLI